MPVDYLNPTNNHLAQLLPNPLDLKRATGHRDLKSLDILLSAHF
ncbi:hypothetical protein ApDm4_1407 [Acetobacter pomorum]|nr:hypothetical protein ApDm4_1407 [Acetobacter pomorum]